MLFEDVAEEWMAKFLPSLTPKEAARRRRYLEKLCYPQLALLPIADVTPRLLLERVLRPIEEAGTLETARRVTGILSQLFRYAVASGQAERDVTRDLAGALPAPIVRHRATIIDPAEIKRLLDGISSYNGTPSVTFALKILPYVFVRPGELRHAEWTDIDIEGATWRIPAVKMKMRTARLVPLADQVKVLLEELHTFTGTGRYLFPGAWSKDKPISDMAINAALRYLGFGKDEICGHGFRAMASTLLNEKGYSPDWIERQLAHSERNGVRAAYNHAEYLAERRRMMQEWADWLDSLRLG